MRSVSLGAGIGANLSVLIPWPTTETLSIFIGNEWGVAVKMRLSQKRAAIFIVRLM